MDTDQGRAPLRRGNHRKPILYALENRWGRHVPSSPVLSGSYIASFCGSRGGGGNKRRGKKKDKNNNGNHDDEEDEEDEE